MIDILYSCMNIFFLFRFLLI